ncbi:MAG TPA: hypothetical protein VKB88_09255 [Bryobacteraceae bacterium]|nr:hypothetical protein [Bryobacteraceae bacterium]
MESHTSSRIALCDDPNMGIAFQHGPAHVTHQTEHRGLRDAILGQSGGEGVSKGKPALEHLFPDVFRVPFDQRWSWREGWCTPTWIGETAERCYASGVPFHLL